MNATSRLLTVVLGLGLVRSTLVAQSTQVSKRRAVEVEGALRAVTPDLDRRLAQFRPVRMPFNAASLTPRERRMVDEIIVAMRQLESVYWRQSDPEGLALYQALTPAPPAGSGAPGPAPTSSLRDKLRRFLLINGSRFDLVDENRPFVGTLPMPPGRALYPAGLTRADIESYVAKHPESRAAIYNPFTVIHRTGPALTTRFYHDEYQPFIARAAAALDRAAARSADAAFANFLRLRARALLTDDYYESDIAWVELKNPKFDVIFAPYETYLDDLLGVKTSYGASLLIRNEAESRKLDLYERWIPDIQDTLPLAPEDRPSVRGHLAPMEMMDAPYRTGDLRHGYQAVADNLPNDPRIHQEKGAKHIFFKNFMDARVTDVILPLAAHVMDPAQARAASADGYLASTLMHEISHGLGPALARHNRKSIDVREAIGPAYSGLEEAKADVVGMFGLKWLVDHGVLPKERLDEYYASYVAGIFRTVRFGTGEAHGRAEMMEFNYLFEQAAIAYANGRYRIDYARMPAAIQQLSKELLEQEATGDRSRTEAWFTKYDRVPPDLGSALAAARDVPIDVDPVFSFSEAVQ